MKNRSIRLVVAGVVVSCSAVSTTFACGACAFAGFDMILPPIMFWSALSLVWFLSIGVVSSLFHLKFRGQPSVLWALGIAAIALFLSGAFLGPIPLLLLAIPPLYTTARAIRSKPEDLVLARARKATLLLALAHGTAAVVGLWLLVHTMRTRTDAAYICEWSGTGPGHGRFVLLRKEEPASIDSYRYIVEHGSGWIVGKAAARLGEIGEPTRDADLLRRARSNVEEAARAQIDEALSSLERRKPMRNDGG